MSSPLLARAVVGPLETEEAERLMHAVMAGELEDVAVAGLLGALAAREITPAELAGFAAALSARMVPLTGPEGAIDTCGTGGSGRATLNTSTLAGVVSAACGAVVAKHGNRSASGRCGSLDVLEALGACVDLSPEDNEACLLEHRFAFVNARAHHPGLARLGPVRKALGFRTVFNLLGPILNPARVRRQLLGVSRADLGPALAEALLRMGHTKAWVVAGPGGLDEIGLLGSTQVWSVASGEVKAWTLDPQAELGLSAPALGDALDGGDAKYNARRFMEILGGKDQGPASDFVALNAGAALVVADLAKSLDEGFETARNCLRSGRAAETFTTWTEATRRRGEPKS